MEAYMVGGGIVKDASIFIETLIVIMTQNGEKKL